MGDRPYRVMSMVNGEWHVQRRSCFATREGAIRRARELRKISVCQETQVRLLDGTYRLVWSSKEDAAPPSPHRTEPP